MENQNNVEIKSSQNNINFKVKNDIIFELPIHISKNLFIDWIDVKDICRIENAYLNEINRNKIKKL